MSLDDFLSKAVSDCVNGPETTILSIHRPSVYVAAPYSKPEGLEVMNVMRAIRQGQEIFEAGFSPMIPHLMYWWQQCYPLSWEEVMEVCLSWVQKADAVFRMPGESLGADLEVEAAKAKGIPIFTQMDLMEEVFEGALSRAREESHHPERATA